MCNLFKKLSFISSPVDINFVPKIAHKVWFNSHNEKNSKLLNFAVLSCSNEFLSFSNDKESYS